MKLITFAALLFACCQITEAQICDSIAEKNYSGFAISFEKKATPVNEFLILHITKNKMTVLTDTVLTDKKDCTGFAVPDMQPFKEYFIFSKHQKGNGKTYILSNTGECTVINGGTFWAAPKHQLLFLLAERDLTNLVIYSLKEKKVLLEKFNCDEFENWYYQHGHYMGNVMMECGIEPEQEHEISSWLYQVEVEQYEPAKNSLSETHTNHEHLEKAKKLVRYASCK